MLRWPRPLSILPILQKGLVCSGISLRVLFLHLYLALKTTLFYEEPIFSNEGTLKIKAIEEEILKGEEYGKNSLIGYFVSSRSSFHVVRSRVNTIWNLLDPLMSSLWKWVSFYQYLAIRKISQESEFGLTFTINSFFVLGIMTLVWRKSIF